MRTTRESVGNLQQSQQEYKALAGAGHTFMNVVCIFRYVAFSPAPPAPRSARQEGRQPPPLPLLLLFWTNQRRPVQDSAGSAPCSPTSQLTPSSSKTRDLLAKKHRTAPENPHLTLPVPGNLSPPCHRAARTHPEGSFPPADAGLDGAGTGGPGTETWQGLSQCTWWS